MGVVEMRDEDEMEDEEEALDVEQVELDEVFLFRERKGR